MILELDLGNTRAKWRTIDALGRAAESGIGPLADWLAGQAPVGLAAGIVRVRIASVLSAAKEALITDRLRALFGVSPEFARSKAACQGLQNAYAEPARLGVDRWLALLAAYQLNRRAVMVVDIGTALTIDIADDGGMHLGGYIVPGVRLMQAALLQGTERVRFEERRELQSIAFGDYTDDCVHNGIAAALVGSVLVAAEQARLRVGQPPAIFVTGGSAGALADRLTGMGIGAQLMPDLVMDGLRWALP